MTEAFSRTERLLGKENMDRLAKAKVLIFGIGGVGGHVVEALARMIAVIRRYTSFNYNSFLLAFLPFPGA